MSKLIKSPTILLGSMIGATDDVSGQVKRSLISLGFNFKEVVGSYNGIAEKTFVIPFTNDAEKKTIISVAKHFSQESILVLDVERNATLEFISKQDNVELGKFTAFTKSQFNLLRNDLKENYTFDGSYYYIAV